MTRHTGASWLVYALGALCAGAIVVAFLLVGPPSQSATVQSRTVKAQQGVVQQTVSGSGNVEPATQLDLGFKTSGVVQAIHVSQDQYVTTGQLLAELNPQSAEAALEQARATLQAAEAALAAEEEDGGESSTSQSSGASSSQTPSQSEGATHKATAAPAPAATTSSGSSTGSEKPRQSAATREANLASARAAVKSDRIAVQSAEQALSDTKLFAPDNGTIVSLAGEVGESVSGTGTSKASTSASSASSGSSSGAAGAGTGSSSARSGSGASSTASSASSGSGSDTPFAVLSDLTTMQLVVGLSESEIVHVHTGQPATVTVEALEGAKLAAHVVSVATLASSSSGVVSYDVTFQLDQTASGLRPGMSGSAEVVVRQEEGVNVPTSAISGSTVTVLQGGRQERRRVVTGLAGNSSTVVLSGLKAGEEVALPVASSSSATSLTSRLAGRGGGLVGGLGGGLGGGGFGAARLGGGFGGRGGG
jgi:multidrug efflux pump subunit AcrA (membrane-fusion protein)